MSILFLDFDGVLNSTLFMLGVHTDCTFLTRQEHETELSFDQKRLDKKAIQLLNDICAATNCTVVISSAWRVGSNRHYLHWLLVSLGFKGYVWGCTPHHPGGSRGDEIKEALAWSAAEGHDVSRYVVLDDCEIFGHGEHFVKTDPNTGLTQSEVDKAIGLLGRSV